MLVSLRLVSRTCECFFEHKQDLCMSRRDLTASLAYWLRRAPRERKIPGSSPACAGIFQESSHTSDLKNWHSSGYPARRLAL